MWPGRRPLPLTLTLPLPYPYPYTLTSHSPTYSYPYPYTPTHPYPCTPGPLPTNPKPLPGHFELPEAVDLDNDWRLQRELNASGAGDPYVRFPLPGLSARARTAEALNAAGQANRNFLRASTRADMYTLRGLRAVCGLRGKQRYL